MFSANSAKFILAALALFVPACGFWQAKTEVAPTPFVAEELKNGIPFSSKEPENYQTEIIVTTGGIEDHTFIARNGANRLTIFDYRKKTEFAVLNFGGSQSFLINRSGKIYAENPPPANDSETKNEFLTNEWLNQKNGAKFEKIGAENDLIKYLVRLDDSTNSEIIVAVDEKIGLPVKEDFYTVNGGQKNLTLTTELKDFSLQTEAAWFEIPQDYKKVALKEFQETARRERAKED